jgi:hypothetical protein
MADGFAGRQIDTRRAMFEEFEAPFADGCAIDAANLSTGPKSEALTRSNAATSFSS